MNTDFKIPSGLGDTLISKYKDFIIEYDNSMPNNIDYEGTIANMAKYIIADYDDAHMMKYFGQVFDDEDIAYKWLIEHLPEMREILYDNF